MTFDHMVTRYASSVGPIHRVDVSLKVFALVVLLVSIVTTQVSIAWVFGAVLLVAAALSRMPITRLFQRLLFLELFVLGVAFLSLLQANGIEAFTTLVIRSTLCLFAVVLFSATTRFTELLDLLKRWRVPTLLVTILTLMYRYLFVLVDELERMRHARTSRTFTTQRRALWISLATIVSQLFIRSTERAERIYAAMCARGWQ